MVQCRWLMPIISPSPLASAGNPLKGLGVSAHKKSAIIKADRDPAIVAALDNFAYFILQRHFGFPGESFRDQPHPIANLETGFQVRILLHFPFAFSPLYRARPSFRCLSNLVLQVVRLVIAAELAWRSLIELKHYLTQFRGFRIPGRKTLPVHFTERADERVAVLAADFVILVAVASVETWFAHAALPLSQR
jgi:hypothetical protein